MSYWIEIRKPGPIGNPHGFIGFVQDRDGGPLEFASLLYADRVADELERNDKQNRAYRSCPAR